LCGLPRTTEDTEKMLKKVAGRIIALIVLLLSVSGPHLAGAQTQDPIDAIRQHYASINQNVARYRRVKKDLSGYSAEGGELIAYFHGPSVMKMVATFFGETGRTVEEYYFWNGQLIFVFQTESRYDKPLSGKVIRKIESRFYFKDDKLIRWLDENGKEVASDSAEYAPKQADYLKFSKELVEGAQSRRATIESKQ
jgi:hypothetical protein